MRPLLKAVPAFLFLLVASIPAFSQVYKWKDKDGNLMISTTPPPPGVQAEERQFEKPSNSEPEARKGSRGRNADGDVELARSNRDIEVILYITDW